MEIRTALVDYKAGQGAILTDSQGSTVSTSTIRSVVPTGPGAPSNGFKPVDLLAMAVASCTLSMVTAALEGRGIDPTGSHIIANYTMADAPHRMDSISIALHLPRALAGDEKLATVILRTAQKCPVATSLSAEMDKQVEMVFDA